MTSAPHRAVVLVDGNNWYHGLKRIGETGQKRLNFARISEKLLGPRTWIGTRYYVGQLEQTGNKQLYAEQRSFVAELTKHPKITVHYGRIETVPTENVLADEMLYYLSELKEGVDPAVRRRLESMARMHLKVATYNEKATDVLLAVDLVRMALSDEYDAAYILSADGDYTPAVDLVRGCGKKVYAASAQPGARLAAVVDKFIPIESAWLADCYF